jgi:hypothetical protein
MAYEFIAAGLDPPGKPLQGYFDVIEGRQRIKANQINLDVAQKNVDAADAWGQVDQNDPESLKAYAEKYPLQFEERQAAMFKRQIDQISLVATKYDMASKLMSAADTPEAQAQAQKWLQENGAGDIPVELFGDLHKPASETGQKIRNIEKDLKNAYERKDQQMIAALLGDLQATVEESTTATELKKWELRAKQASVRASETSISLDRERIRQIQSQPPDPGPTETFIDPKTGKPVIGTRAQAIGKEPVPPAASLADEIAKSNIDAAKRRVSGNLDAIAESYNELSQIGGAVDVTKSPTENLAVSARASGPGQLVGKVLGTKEQSIRNKINQMVPLLMQDIRQAQGAGVRGLDSNKELDFYRQAASDPSRDLQSSFAAINVLSNAYGLGKVYGELDSGEINKLQVEFISKLPLVTNDEEYKKFKKEHPGKEFRDKNGKRWVAGQ